MNTRVLRSSILKAVIKMTILTDKIRSYGVVKYDGCLLRCIDELEEEKRQLFNFVITQWSYHSSEDIGKLISDINTSKGSNQDEGINLLIDKLTKLSEIDSNILPRT